MIKQRTVLVLGAGASQPYNFPLGSALVDKITAEIGVGATSSLRARLEQLGYDRKLSKEFASALRGARPYSIDAFIETRPKFREIAKAAIADVLLRAEASSTVSTADASVDWYRYLFNKFLFLRNIDYYSAQAKKLTVVTFNFDRSFEYALFQNVRYGFGLEADVARNVAMQIDIHHVHGLLGEPDWMATDKSKATPYGVTDEEPLIDATRRAVQSIKIVDEEIEESVLEDVEVALKQAVYVYFIGFGFDERNLSKLRSVDGLQHANAVRGTALGWSAAECTPIHRHFQGGRGISLYQTDDAKGFLAQHAESLFD